MALVLMMTVPGLGLFYGGMVRKKNVVDTVMTSFAITCLITVIFAVITYSLAFTPGSPFIGGTSRAFLQGILSDVSNNTGNPNPLAPTIPEMVYMAFQMTFAIITPALIAGAFAERMKFSAMLIFMRPVGDLRLCADRALGLGSGRLPLERQSEGLGPRARLSPAARSFTSTPVSPV